MKNKFYNVLAMISAVIMFSSCSDNVIDDVPQSGQNLMLSENDVKNLYSESSSVNITAETDTTAISETEEIVYEQINHDYAKDYYDFIDLDDGFYDNACEYENSEKVTEAFESSMEKRGFYFKNVSVTQSVTDDFDMNGSKESYIVVCGKPDREKTDEKTLRYFDIFEETPSIYSLYFVSDRGEAEALEEFRHGIYFSAMYIYPEEKHISVGMKTALYGQEFPVYSWDGNENKCLLSTADGVEKDGCFLRMIARVGVYHPVSPAMWVYDTAEREYRTVNPNPVRIEDFRSEVLKSVINDKDEYDSIIGSLDDCRGVWGIGNRVFLICRDKGNTAVVKNTDGSFKVEISDHFISVWTEDYKINPYDIDYFIALENMKKVNGEKPMQV